MRKTFVLAALVAAVALPNVVNATPYNTFTVKSQTVSCLATDLDGPVLFGACGEITPKDMICLENGFCALLSEVSPLDRVPVLQYQVLRKIRGK